MTNIEYNAFNKCEALAEIELPDTVTQIGVSAFEDTAWFNAAADGLVYAGKVAYCFKGDMPENTEITIDEGTKAIAESCLSWKSNLKSVSIPDSVVRIGTDAFCGASFDSLTLPSSLEVIDSGAFDYCINITELTVPNSVTDIAYGAFSNCDKLASVTLGSSLDYIDEGVFLNCISLESITIPDTVFSIGDAAFENCPALASVKLGSHIESIGSFAFSGCTALATVNIPASLEFVGDYAFFGTPWIDSFADGELYLGKTLYAYKGSIVPGTTVNVKEGTVAISADCFRGGLGLTELTLPDSVEYVGAYAFSETGIESIDLPDYIQDIPEGLFRGCSKLTSIEIPQYVFQIAYRSFENCTALANVGFDINGFLFSIEKYAFSGCTSLTDMITPKYVQFLDYDCGIGLTYNEDEGYTPIDGFKLYCYKDTGAVEYANERNIDYELLNTIASPAEHPILHGLMKNVKPTQSIGDIKALLPEGEYKIVAPDSTEITDVSAKAYTGVQIILYSGDVVSDAITIVVPGDVDGVAGVTTDDARLVLRTSVGLSSLSGAYADAADVVYTKNNDAISTDDARKILRVSVGLDKI